MKKCLIYSFAPEGRCSPSNQRPEGYSILASTVIRDSLECKVIEAYQRTKNPKQEFKNFYDEGLDLIILAIEFVPLPEENIETLYNFVHNGGSLLIFHDAGGDDLLYTNINKLSEKFGIRFNSDFFGCTKEHESENVIAINDYYKEKEPESSQLSRNLYIHSPPEHWKKRFLVEDTEFGEILYWGCTLACDEKEDLVLRGTGYHESLNANPIEDGYREIPYNRGPGGYITRPKILIGRKIEKIDKGKVICFGGKFVFENSSLCIESHIEFFKKIFNWCVTGRKAVKLLKPSLKVRLRERYKRNASIISLGLMILSIILTILLALFK